MFRLAIFVFQIADDVRNADAKKLPMKYQRKAIVDNVCSRGQYEQLEGKEVWRISATKINFEKPPPGGGARGWIRKSPVSASPCFYLRLENRGKGQEVVKVGIVLPPVLIFKINLYATKMSFEKLPEGGWARGWIRNSPKLARLRFYIRPRNRGTYVQVQSKWVVFFHHYFFF